MNLEVKRCKELVGMRGYNWSAPQLWSWPQTEGLSPTLELGYLPCWFQFSGTASLSGDRETDQLKRTHCSAYAWGLTGIEPSPGLQTGAYLFPTSQRVLYSETGCEINPDFTVDIYSMGPFLSHPAAYETLKMTIPVTVKMSKTGGTSYIMPHSYLY